MTARRAPAAPIVAARATGDALRGGRGTRTRTTTTTWRMRLRVIPD